MKCAFKDESYNYIIDLLTHVMKAESHHAEQVMESARSNWLVIGIAIEVLVIVVLLSARFSVR
jgi:hypothetical protein